MMALRLEKSLGNSINRLINSESKSKVVILLTDGENNKGKISPLTAAEIASSDSAQVKVYTIGVGSKGMAKSLLQSIRLQTNLSTIT